MPTTRPDVYPARSHGSSAADHEVRDGRRSHEAAAFTRAMSHRRPGLRARDDAGPQGRHRAGQPGPVSRITTPFAPRPSVGRGRDLGNRQAGSRRPRRPRGRARGILRIGPAPALLRLRRPGQDGRRRYPGGLSQEDIESWALALAGAAAPVRAKVLVALSGSAANRLRQHLDGLGPFRLSDSEAAQAEIAELLRRMYDRGRISLPEPSGREEVIV